MTWDDVFTELRRFATLTDNWDGDGAPAPTMDAIDMALQRAYEMRDAGRQPPGWVLVGINGTIWMEWADDGYHYEIEFG